MRISELLRLSWININQNRFKTIMTSIGIVVGAATIVMVIAIGRGGQMDVAEQFSSLNAGAIDVTYEYEGEDTSSGGFSIGNFFGGMQNFFSGGSGGMDRGSSGSGSGSFGMGGSSSGSDSSSGGMGSGSFGMGGDSSGSGGPSMGGGPQMGGSSGSDSSSGSSSQSMMPSGGDSAAPSLSSSDGGMPQGSGQMGGSDSDTASADDAADGSSLTSQQEAAEDETDALSDGGDEDSEEEDSVLDSRMNQEEIILTQDDVDDIEMFVTGITGATISYTTKSSVEGGTLSDAQTYTIAGVKENYASLSNLSLLDGEFLTDEDNDNTSRVCVLGKTAASEIFGTTEDVVGSTIYIDDRTYTVIGLLKSTQTVSAGISPDEAVLIPYDTGVKYITGKNVSAKITVIAEDVSEVSRVEADVQTVLSDNYNNAQFTFEDAGSKMEAAEASNRTLTILLTAMACIVFIVGGIGIMNVLFVSVKERTNEIGILKALGASRSAILLEFLVESAAISLIGGILGVALSFAVTPVIEYYGVRVEANITAWMYALGFAVLTGTLFGFYPAWKASRLIPVEALQSD